MSLDKIKMLCTGDYEPEQLPKFKGILDIEKKGFSLGDGSSMIVLEGKGLAEYLAGKEIYIIGHDAVTEDIIKKSTDVGLLLSVRGGPEENIGIDTCTTASIPVISSAGRCTVSVAEFTFLLTLVPARPAVPVIERIRSEGWTKQNLPSPRGVYTRQPTELYNKNFGIIRFRCNAKSLSVLADAFHAQVNAYGPYVSEEVMDSFHVKKMDSDQVVKTADCIIVPVRLTPDTEDILSQELIFSMKPTASIVNTRRVGLVNGEAIPDALEQQVIKSTTLSVYTPKPLDAFSENRIYQIPEDRLITTSHAAGVTEGRSWHQYHFLYKQLSKYFQGNIPKGRVNKQVSDTPQFKERGGKYFGVR